MGFLDNFLKRKQPKVKIEEEPVKIVQQPEEPVKSETQAGTQGQVLSDKIHISFSKLNLDKADVRAQRLFLLDVSGSMGDKVDKRRKIEHLRDVMSRYKDANKVCFSSGVHTGQDIPEPDGGTNLAMALAHVRKIEQKPKRIVLVSDGEPNSETEALREATQLAIPVDIIFIGEKGGKGERFMEKLAQTTGGEHFVV